MSPSNLSKRLLIEPFAFKIIGGGKPAQIRNRFEIPDDGRADIAETLFRIAARL